MINILSEYLSHVSRKYIPIPVATIHFKHQLCSDQFVVKYLFGSGMVTLIMPHRIIILTRTELSHHPAWLKFRLLWWYGLTWKITTVTRTFRPSQCGGESSGYSLPVPPVPASAADYAVNTPSTGAHFSIKMPPYLTVSGSLWSLDRLIFALESPYL